MALHTAQFRLDFENHVMKIRGKPLLVHTSDNHVRVMSGPVNVNSALNVKSLGNVPSVREIHLSPAALV